MNLYKIEAGNFKLDGGSMFGVVPKSLWQKVYPADENNMCNLATRCLLIEDNNRLILIDAGLGNKQSEKFFSYYYLNGDYSLEKSLRSHGFSANDITDLILTHLHFDHCGGAVTKGSKDKFELTFPNANYWLSRRQLEWAKTPNQRERASYLAENFETIEHSGKMNLLGDMTDFSDSIQLRSYNGHTEGLLIPFINYRNRILVYVSDLFPITANIPVSWVCGFDTQPLVSLDEHAEFLQEAVEKDYILFFEHDINTECCTVKNTDKGIRVDKTFRLSDIPE